MPTPLQAEEKVMERKEKTGMIVIPQRQWKSLESQNTEAGLSVIELVMVVLIIAIVIAFSLPVISNSLAAYNLRSAADHLAERIAAVRALAIAKNRNVTFSFNNASGLYGFDFTGPTGDGVPETTDPDDPATNYYTGSLPTGVTTTFPENQPMRITFSSRGELPIGDLARVITLQRGNRTITVRVNLRGKVSVE